jgi:hypothetical protein
LPPGSTELSLAPKPAWWPSASTTRGGDAVALAFWRGAIAATQWLAEAVTR